MRVLRFTIFTFLLSLLLASPAVAHKVNLFAYVEGGTIYTESYFPDGKTVKQGRIEIYDAQGQLLVTGSTDNQGLYQVAIPVIDDLRIEVIASMGHRNHFLLKRAEIEAGK